MSSASSSFSETMAQAEMAMLRNQELFRLREQMADKTLRERAIELATASGTEARLMLRAHNIYRFLRAAKEQGA